MRQETLTMTKDEIKCLQVVRKVLEGQIKQIDGSKAIGISDRQLRRLMRRVETQGDAGIIHKARGKPSHRRLTDRLRQKVLGLYQRYYEGFGPTLAAEKLKERNKVCVSKETLRLWLAQNGLWQVRGLKAKRHLQWRERKDHCGQMVQMDGSHHDWLEGRGPVLVLMGMIDDATGRVFGRFYDYEGTIPAMDVVKRYIDLYGIPTSIYLDRHRTYRSKRNRTIEEELDNDRPRSHFERSCELLSIDLIHANSPQAKGRVERLFKTLQDRLVKELRLADAKDLKQANKVIEGFLIKFNGQFNIMPKESGDMHRMIPPKTDLTDIFSVKTLRVLRNDNTVAHEKHWYQVLSPSRAKDVIVQEMLDGSMNILSQGHRLRFKEIKQQPKKVYAPKVRKTTYRRQSSAKHPWRSGYGKKLSQQSKNRTFLFC